MEHDQTIQTPYMMRMHRALEKGLRGKTGDPIEPEQTGTAWKRLSTKDRHTLRLAHLFNLTSQPFIDDMKNPYLNMALMACILIPGPGVSAVAVPLALSYLVRTDERAKQVRSQIKDMMKNGIPLEDYKHYIKNHKHDIVHPYRVDRHNLIKTKMDKVDKGLAELRDAASMHGRNAYGKLARRPFQKTMSVVYKMIRPVVGEQHANCFLESVFNGASRTEKKVAGFYKKTADCAGQVAQKAKQNLKETFSAAVEVHQEFGAALYYGWEANKQELRNSIGVRRRPTL